MTLHCCNDISSSLHHFRCPLSTYNPAPSWLHLLHKTTKSHSDAFLWYVANRTTLKGTLKVIGKCELLKYHSRNVISISCHENAYFEQKSYFSGQHVVGTIQTTCLGTTWWRRLAIFSLWWPVVVPAVREAAAEEFVFHDTPLHTTAMVPCFLW